MTPKRTVPARRACRLSRRCLRARIWFRSAAGVVARKTRLPSRRHSLEPPKECYLQRSLMPAHAPENPRHFILPAKIPLLFRCSFPFFLLFYFRGCLHELLAPPYSSTSEKKEKKKPEEVFLALQSEGTSFGSCLRATCLLSGCTSGALKYASGS